MINYLQLLRASVVIVAGAAHAVVLHAAEIDPAMQAKIDLKIPQIATWASDPAIVAAVVANNATPPPGHTSMTQDKWKSLSLLDPFVRSFSKNEIGLALKARKVEWVTEAFVSDAKGFKAGFLAKPSNWCHAGTPKQDVPLTGKPWQGALVIDESTGLQQLQVAVPVLKDGLPIGVLVVGLAVAKL